jgi:hypothetical protein
MYVNFFEIKKYIIIFQLIKISWSYLLDEYEQIAMPSFFVVCTYLTKFNTLIVFLFLTTLLLLFRYKPICLIELLLIIYNVPRFENVCSYSLLLSIFVARPKRRGVLAGPKKGPSCGRTQREEGSWPDPKEMGSWPAPKAIGSRLDPRRNGSYHPKRSGSRSDLKAFGLRLDPRRNGSCHPKRSASWPYPKEIEPRLDLRRNGSCHPKEVGLVRPQMHLGRGSTQGEMSPASLKEVGLGRPQRQFEGLWLNLNRQKLGGEGPSHDPWENGSRPTPKLNRSQLTP